MAPVVAVRALKKAGSDPKTPLKSEKRLRREAYLKSLNSTPKEKGINRAARAEAAAAAKSAEKDDAKLPLLPVQERIPLEQYRRNLCTTTKICCEKPGTWLEIRLTVEAFREFVQPVAVGLMPSEFDSSTSLVMGSIKDQEKLRDFCGLQEVAVTELTFVFMPAEGKLSLHSTTAN